MTDQAPKVTQAEEEAARDLARAIRERVTASYWREGELIEMCMEAFARHRASTGDDTGVLRARYGLSGGGDGSGFDQGWMALLEVVERDFPHLAATPPPDASNAEAKAVRCRDCPGGDVNDMRICCMDRPDASKGLAAKLAKAHVETFGGNEDYERRAYDAAIVSLKADASNADDVVERCAKIAEGFSRMMDKPDHADAPKLIAAAIRASPRSPVADAESGSRFPCSHPMSPENTAWRGHEPICSQCASRPVADGVVSRHE